MLQISTGRFFNPKMSTIEISDNDVFYSNLRISRTIKTPVGDLELINTSNNIYTYIFRFNGKIHKGYPICNHSEAINDFRILCIFGLKSIFTNDKNQLLWFCRSSNNNPNEIILPSEILPDYFKKTIIADEELIKNFETFINKVLNLPRERYKAVLNSITSFVQAFDIINYNFELAFSLMVYALESLTSFDKHEIVWADYDSKVRLKLDKLFDETDSFDGDLAEKIRYILVENTYSKSTAQFINFCMKYTNENFFKEESENMNFPLKKSELKKVLENAYDFRSGYAHILKKLDSSFEYKCFRQNQEVIRYNALDKNKVNNVFLTFTGLTRLTCHIISNFILKSKSLKKEEYDYVKGLPHISNLMVHPKYWISDASIFKQEDIFITFSYFLIIYQESFKTHEFCDLKDVMLKIEKLLKKGVKREFKPDMVSFYYLYNEIVSPKYKSPNYPKFLFNYENILNAHTIANLINCFILKEKINLELNEVIKIHEMYNENRFHKNVIKIPTFLEVDILIYISNEYLKIGDNNNFKYWLNKAILELSAERRSQLFLEYCIKNNIIINIDKFNNLLINNKIYEF